MQPLTPEELLRWTQVVAFVHLTGDLAEARALDHERAVDRTFRFLRWDGGKSGLRIRAAEAAAVYRESTHPPGLPEHLSNRQSGRKRHRREPERRPWWAP